MKFDVVIATYNRENSLNILVRQILECKRLPENIIIVDSSLEENKNVQQFDIVKYIHSSHSNQPYQRYVGYLASCSDVLIYFDDDMRVIDDSCFDKILISYDDINVVGVQPSFTYKHDFFDHQIPKSKTRELAKKSKLFNILKKISGNPDIKDGKFWLAGLRGKKPDNGGLLEWFNGPVFSARKDCLYHNFNFNLFEQYENKVGKAEDAILGFTLSRSGDIIYLSDNMFFHDDQEDSVYSVNLLHYGMRVAYSRLYLSFEFARLSESSKLLAFGHFNLYIFGRIFNMLLNQLVGYKRSRSQLVLGYLKGYMKSIIDINKMLLNDSGYSWRNRACNNLKMSNNSLR